MGHPPAEKSHWYPAPCRGARRLLLLAVGATLLIGLTAAADLLLRATRQDEAAGAWMKALTLSAPALWSAGNPLRHPETVHPGVDVRFSPGLTASP